MSTASAQTTFWLFATVMGLSLCYIFVVFTQSSIVRVFYNIRNIWCNEFIWLHNKKKSVYLADFHDGFNCIIVASLVNLFMQSSAIQFMISVVGVLVFTG